MAACQEGKLKKAVYFRYFVQTPIEGRQQTVFVGDFSFLSAERLFLIKIVYVHKQKAYNLIIMAIVQQAIDNRW